MYQHYHCVKCIIHIGKCGGKFCTVQSKFYEVCRGIRGQTNDPHEHTHTHTHSLASTRIGATALATTSIRDK